MTLHNLVPHDAIARRIGAGCSSVWIRPEPLPSKDTISPILVQGFEILRIQRTTSRSAAKILELTLIPWYFHIRDENFTDKPGRHRRIQGNWASLPSYGAPLSWGLFRKGRVSGRDQGLLQPRRKARLLPLRSRGHLHRHHSPLQGHGDRPPSQRGGLYRGHGRAPPLLLR